MRDELVIEQTAKMTAKKGFSEPSTYAYSRENDDIVDPESKMILQSCHEYTGREYFTEKDIQSAIEAKSYGLINIRG